MILRRRSPEQGLFFFYVNGEGDDILMISLISTLLYLVIGFGIGIRIGPDKSKNAWGRFLGLIALAIMWLPIVIVAFIFVIFEVIKNYLFSK